MDVDIDDDDGDTFNLIQPTLFQQIRNILDQYPDDGQILKVKGFCLNWRLKGMCFLIPGLKPWLGVIALCSSKSYIASL